MILGLIIIVVHRATRQTLVYLTRCRQDLTEWFRSLWGVAPAGDAVQLLLVLLRPVSVAGMLLAYRCG